MLPKLIRASELELTCAVLGATDPDDVAPNFNIWRDRNREVPVLDFQIVAHIEEFPNLTQSKFDVFITAHRDRVTREGEIGFRLREFFSASDVKQDAAQDFDRRARHLNVQPVVYEAESADELIAQFSQWRDEPVNSNLLIMGITVNCRAFRIREENVVLYNAFVLRHLLGGLRAA